MRRKVTVDGRLVEVESPNYLGAIVRKQVAMRFNIEARQRNLSITVLMRRLLTNIATGDLFKAVLDD